MSLMRRMLLVVALTIIVLCVVLLLNFTASNPTGRRYSSEVVVTIEESQVIGASGESVLASDLHLPNNNEPDQRQCLCSRRFGSTLNACNVCLVEDSQFFTQTYRIPDFISEAFIAESKNRQHLLTNYSDQFQQISDYARGAKLLNRPLWLYVRVDTLVDPKFVEIVESTGGGIVYYFAVPGYIDAVDLAAGTGLVFATPMLLVLGLWEVRSRRKSRIVVVPTRPVPKPTQPEADPLRKANNAADFAQRAKDKARRRIDLDEEYIDL